MNITRYPAVPTQAVGSSSALDGPEVRTRAEGILTSLKNRWSNLRRRLQSWVVSGLTTLNILAKGFSMQRISFIKSFIMICKMRSNNYQESRDLNLFQSRVRPSSTQLQARSNQKTQRDTLVCNQKVNIIAATISIEQCTLVARRTIMTKGVRKRLGQKSHLQPRQRHQRVLKTIRPVCPLQKQSLVMPQGTVSEGMMGQSQRMLGGQGKPQMFWVSVKYKKDASDAEEECEVEMRSEIVDVPGGEYADQKNINLNRLLSDDNYELIELLVSVDYSVEAHRPLVSQIHNALHFLPRRKPAINQEKYCHCYKDQLLDMFECVILLGCTVGGGLGMMGDGAWMFVNGEVNEFPLKLWLHQLILIININSAVSILSQYFQFSPTYLQTSSTTCRVWDGVSALSILPSLSFFLEL